MCARTPPALGNVRRRSSTTMRMHPKEYPLNRRGDPKRRAEYRVFEALAGINRQGFVYYEWRKGYERVELDFAIWVEGLGRFALQVKGGRYLVSDGDWFLKTREGPLPASSCPLDEAKLAALDLHDNIQERAATPYSPYVIPVMAFADMDPDPAIQRLAQRMGVYVVWGSESMLEDLAEIRLSRSVSDRLPMHRIAREVEAVTDGLIRLDVPLMGETDDSASPPFVLSLSIGGRNLIHVRTREVHFRRGTVIRLEVR